MLFFVNAALSNFEKSCPVFMHIYNVKSFVSPQCFSGVKKVMAGIFQKLHKKCSHFLHKTYQTKKAAILSIIEYTNEQMLISHQETYTKPKNSAKINIIHWTSENFASVLSWCECFVYWWKKPLKIAPK